MNIPIRILHLDDSSTDAELVAMALAMHREEFPAKVHCVQNQDQYLAALEKRDFDIILSDYRMPDFDGDQALRAARELCPEIPFIMVTGELGEERAIETLKRGATDYVLKDRIFRLIPAMKRALAEAEIERRQRQAEEALRESEQRLRATFNNAALGIVEADVQGRFLAVNDRICSILGYGREELLQMSVDELTAPEDREESRRINAKIVAGETDTYEYEKRYLRRDGSRLWVHVTVSGVRNNAGEVVRAIGTVEDISARKQVEERVQDLARFPDENPAPVMRVRTDGSLLYANAASKHLLDAWNIGVVGRMDQVLQRELVRAMREKSSRTIDLAVANSIVSLLVVPVPDRGYVNLYGMDVTEQRRLEEALRESENRYRSIFENSHAVMLLIDPDTGRIVDANPAASRYYGWSRKDLASMMIDQINMLAPTELATELAAARDERRGYFMFRHRRSGGDVRDVEVYSGPIRVHGRQLLHSIVHDVTERRAAEARLQRHLENSPLAVIEWDKEYHVTRWSKEAIRLFGYGSDETLGKRINELDLVHPEDISLVEETMRRLSNGKEQAVVSENRNITREGKVVHCIWYNSVLTDPNGGMSSVMSLVLDVTAERRGKASLEKTIESLRVLVTNSGEHMLLVDREGMVLCSSRRAAMALGYGSKELEGKKWSEFLPEEQLMHARFFYRDLMRDPGGRTTAALNLLMATGEKALFSLTTSRVSLGDSFGYVIHVERVTAPESAEMPRVDALATAVPNLQKRKI